VRPHRAFVVAFARNRGLPLASHDDTTIDHVAEAHADGAIISEFPTRVDAARAAREHGMHVVMGAPNVVRGGSHSGNVAAIDLARFDLLDVLSSDYVPASLLLAAFRLVGEAGFTVPRAVATVTARAADAVRLADRGRIAPGLRADLVQVAMTNGEPHVRTVWRSGMRIT
jgi:alpha-D-ribose 1-methylphosphonate 5-triphosphate diphosphatase